MSSSACAPEAPRRWFAQTCSNGNPSAGRSYGSPTTGDFTVPGDEESPSSPASIVSGENGSRRVANAVDPAQALDGKVERTVASDDDIDELAPGARALEPARGEIFDARDPAVAERHAHDLVARGHRG